tara:strand:- start:10 stop:351 length:342 start_codon:yes stop_codon:yes gene_type:complete
MEERLRKELQECNRKLSLTAGSRERALEANFHEQIQTTDDLRSEVIELRQERDHLMNQVKSYGDHIANISVAHNNLVLSAQNISHQNTQLKLINAQLEKRITELMANLTVLQL